MVNSQAVYNNALSVWALDGVLKQNEDARDASLVSCLKAYHEPKCRGSCGESAAAHAIRMNNRTALL